MDLPVDHGGEIELVLLRRPVWSEGCRFRQKRKKEKACLRFGSAEADPNDPSVAAPAISHPGSIEAHAEGRLRPFRWGAGGVTSHWRCADIHGRVCLLPRHCHRGA